MLLPLAVAWAAAAAAASDAGLPPDLASRIEAWSREIAACETRTCAADVLVRLGGTGDVVDHAFRRLPETVRQANDGRALREKLDAAQWALIRVCAKTGSSSGLSAGARLDALEARLGRVAAMGPGADRTLQAIELDREAERLVGQDMRELSTAADVQQSWYRNSAPQGPAQTDQNRRYAERLSALRDRLRQLGVAAVPGDRGEAVTEADFNRGRLQDLDLKRFRMTHNGQAALVRGTQEFAKAWKGAVITAPPAGARPLDEASVPAPRNPDVVGDPDSWKRFHTLQQSPTTCAVAAQLQVLERRGLVKAGTPEHRAMVEREMAAELSRQGAYFGQGQYGGTPPEYIAQMLKTRGLLTARRLDAAPDDIQTALSKRRDVLVDVDSGVLRDDAASRGMGHTIIVTGVHLDARRQPSCYYVNDAARSDGAGECIPAGRFVAAWSARSRLMVEVH